MAIIEINTDANPAFIDTSAFSSGSTTTLQQAYTNGGAGPQLITLSAAGLGVRIIDAAPTIGGSLFLIGDNAQATTYFRISTQNGASSPILFTSPAPDVTTGNGYVFDTVNDYTVASAKATVLFRNIGNIYSRFILPSATQTEFDLFTNGGVRAVGFLGSSNSPFCIIDSFGADGASTHIQVGANASIANASAKLLQIVHNIGAAATEVWSWQLAQMNVPANAIFASSAQSATNTTAWQDNPNVADGASSVVRDINNQTTISTAGAHYFRIRNNGAAVLDVQQSATGTTIYGSGGANAFLRLDDTNAAVLAFSTTNYLGFAVFNANTLAFTLANVHIFDMQSTAFFPASDGIGALGKLASRFNGLYNSGPLGGKYNLQSGTTYTVVAGDYYVGLSSSSARTITLCAASAFYAGQMLVIDDQSGAASTGNITINRAGGDTIDGGTSTTIITNNGDKMFISDGVSKWFTIGKGL